LESWCLDEQLRLARGCQKAEVKTGELKGGKVKICLYQKTTEILLDLSCLLPYYSRKIRIFCLESIIKFP
jgi:hypothetical protein